MTMTYFSDLRSSSPSGRFTATNSVSQDLFTLSFHEWEALVWEMTFTHGPIELYVGDSGDVVVRFFRTSFRAFDIDGRECARFSVATKPSDSENVYVDPYTLNTSAGLSALRLSHGYFFECKSRYFAIATQHGEPLVVGLNRNSLLDVPLPREVRIAHDTAEVTAALRQVQDRKSGRDYCYYQASILSLCRHRHLVAIPYLQRHIEVTCQNPRSIRGRCSFVLKAEASSLELLAECKLALRGIGLDPLASPSYEIQWRGDPVPSLDTELDQLSRPCCLSDVITQLGAPDLIRTLRKREGGEMAECWLYFRGAGEQIRGIVCVWTQACPRSGHPVTEIRKLDRAQCLKFLPACDGIIEVDTCANFIDNCAPQEANQSTLESETKTDEAMLMLLAFGFVAALVFFATTLILGN